MLITNVSVQKKMTTEAVALTTCSRFHEFQGVPNSPRGKTQYARMKPTTTMVILPTVYLFIFSNQEYITPDWREGTDIFFTAAFPRTW